jgi:cysteine desulfurase
MHANNETGVIQPIDEIASFLIDKSAYFHIDAAQTFGKILNSLQKSRIDLISVSSHKIYGPKGVGALAMRRRNMKRVPLTPLLFGGGQEKGLRPGTLPVSLIAGLGLAAELSLKNHIARNLTNTQIKKSILNMFDNISAVTNGDQNRCLPNVINISLLGVDSEAVMVAVKDIACISNGSACTSASYTPSHVLSAMGLSDDRIESALRISWCHMTQLDDVVENITERIKILL